MKDRTPFGIAGLWENWRHPQSGERIRTFAIITVPANELVAQIHDRMPLMGRTLGVVVRSGSGRRRYSAGVGDGD
jgi:hypothetical protein